MWTRAVDVTDKTALDAALADFCAGNPNGGLDMTWNNAGIGESGWFEDVPQKSEIRTKAPKRGPFRLMPASSVAEVALQAYHQQRRLHWYVPPSIRWIDRMKGLSPEAMRRLVFRSLPALTNERP